MKIRFLLPEGNVSIDIFHVFQRTRNSNILIYRCISRVLANILFKNNWPASARLQLGFEIIFQPNYIYNILLICTWCIRKKDPHFNDISGGGKNLVRGDWNAPL